MKTLLKPIGPAAAKNAAKNAPRAPRTSPKERARIAEIFRRFEAAEPDPKTELRYTSPYTLLVAVALSAQATDVSVNKATERLFAVADTPEAMLRLGEAGLIEHIKSIGLFRTKAKNVIAAARMIVALHGGETPLRRVDLEALPGVGAKTASVVLNELAVEPAIAVDTHVFRVAHRLGLAKGKTPDHVQNELMALTPPGARTRAHHWLILHGRYVCIARKPRCEVCLLNDLCPSSSLPSAPRA
jgi:endonuclease-3